MLEVIRSLVGWLNKIKCVKINTLVSVDIVVATEFFTAKGGVILIEIGLFPSKLKRTLLIFRLYYIA